MAAPRRGRDRILAAATAALHERGYEGASIRSIARRAEVESSLVHHYFGDKAGLFTEVVHIPLQPDRFVASVLDGPLEIYGQRLVRNVRKRQLLGQLARDLGSADAVLRASLAASRMAGLLLMRFVMEVEPLASASIDESVDSVGPVIQWHLTGNPPPLTGSDAPGTVDPMALQVSTSSHGE